MSETEPSTADYDEPGLYEIRIRGHLADEWGNWFDGLTITLADKGHTLLTGPVADQAALHGLLRKVRDLGLPLLSVNRIRPNPADAPDVTLILRKITGFLFWTCKIAGVLFPKSSQTFQ